MYDMRLLRKIWRLCCGRILQNTSMDCSPAAYLGLYLKVLSLRIFGFQLELSSPWWMKSHVKSLKRQMRILEKFGLQSLGRALRPFLKCGGGRSAPPRFLRVLGGFGFKFLLQPHILLILTPDKRIYNFRIPRTTPTHGLKKWLFERVY